MTWVQPLCEKCWRNEYPDRQPYRVIDDDPWTCCLCGAETRRGIYVRRDPRTVPYPRVDP